MKTKKTLIIAAVATVVIFISLLTVYYFLPRPANLPRPRYRVTISSFWRVTADGRTVSFWGVYPDDTIRYNASSNIVLSQKRSQLQHILDSMLTIKGELDYYMSIHDVQDEGYHMVARYENNVQRTIRRTRKAIHIIDSLPSTSKIKIQRCHFSSKDSIKNEDYVFLESLGGVWQAGRWTKASKQGRGIGYDASGRMIRAVYQADTVTRATRVDSAGVYFGSTIAQGIAQGHGIYINRNGKFYEGRWAEGMRNGFGISSSFGQHLRAGEWINDRYKGERVTYTSERIYGIDLSRYQHEIGKKKFKINWKHLRIISLGQLSKKKVKGVIDYPISFIYIKATEGKSVRNKYFLTDYRQAKKHGYHAGAYHFFSTVTSGALQARYFIRHAAFNKGDFPPVLDVEPSNKQITRMGGSHKMWQEIRSWLRIVQRHTGVRPILYISQQFVNRYLPDAPDIKNKYKVWIARYGDYKPDIRLIYWQLSPDGRVRGIHGEVDISVFNGYQDQYRLFISNERIK